MFNKHLKHRLQMTQNLSDLPNAGQRQSENYQAVVLRNITAARMSVLSALQNKLIACNIGAATWHLQFSAQQGSPAGPLIRARGEWLGHRIIIWLPQVLLQRTLQTCMPQLSAASVPQALFPAVASNALGVWLETLPHRESLRIDQMDAIAAIDAIDEINAVDKSSEMPDAPEKPAYTRLHMLARCQAPVPIPIDYTIAIDLDPALTDALPKLCATLPDLSCFADRFAQSQVVHSLPLQLQCEIGRVMIPYATLDALQPGDILFFNPLAEDGTVDFTHFTVQLNYRQQPLMRARIQPPDLMVITNIDMNDRKTFLYDDLIDESAADPFHTATSLAALHAVDEFEEEGEGEGNERSERSGQSEERERDAIFRRQRSAIDGLNQLQVQVVFDVGNCEMSFSELQKLQPGNVIPLASRMPEVVRMTVNGRIIGSGELVEIDGKIGVMLARITDVR
jgi:type III secretion system YscQ/HrcQ family protein